MVVPKISDPRFWMAIIITMVWGIAAIASIIAKNYTVLGTITPLMVAVVGFLFGRGNGAK